MDLQQKSLEDDPSTEDQISVGGHSTSGDSVANKETAALEILKAKDRRKVFYLRLLTLGILFAAALALCLSIHFYLKNSEEEAFEEAYNEQTEKVFRTLQQRLTDRISAIDYFGLTMVSHTISMNVQWPKLYLPHVEVRGVSTDKLCYLLACLVFKPLLTSLFVSAVLPEPHK